LFATRRVVGREALGLEVTCRWESRNSLGSRRERGQVSGRTTLEELDTL